MNEFQPELTKRQTEAWEWLHKPEIEELLYGGGKYGGKSVFGCYWMYLECYELARIQVPVVPSSPIPIGFMGRKIAKIFKETTLDTWRKFIPSQFYTFKGDPPAIIIARGRVQIRTGGLDNREDIQKFHSAELARVFLDQAEETTADDVAALRAATRWRLILNGHIIQGKILFTANPAPSWLKREFILNPSPQRKFVKALLADNPYADALKYEQTLRDAYKHRPELIQAYLFGDWDVIEGANQCIKDAWLQALINRAGSQAVEKEYLVCDPARFGDDETVIFRMKNADIAEKVIMPYCRTTEISGRLKAMSAKGGDLEIVVESIGADIGAGVIDELMQMKARVIQFNPAMASNQIDPQSQEKIYSNLRAEAWDYAAKVLFGGVFPHSNTSLICNTDIDGQSGMDDTTRGQLCTPSYSYNKGRLVIEPKEDIKKRLGHSPDRADTYVIALWAWPFISPKIKRGEHDLRHLRKFKDPMLM